jgi:hypothetical protein
MKKTISGLVAVVFLFPASVISNDRGSIVEQPKKQSVRLRSVLWRQPTDIRTRNLSLGPGGQRLRPQGPFKFIKEDSDGSSPKFVVQDIKGVQWKVKLGDEAKPETAATRLLWAVGYFADIDYYHPSLQVIGLPKLNRGQKYLSGNVVHGARLERVDKSVKKVDDWSWFDNPFVGSKEFNGLRVMMALMNNWDLKEVNNAIYDVDRRERRYVVSDLGATFGRTGGGWTRSKGSVEDYLESRFIDDVEPTKVDLVLHSRPPILYAAAIPYYRERTRMSQVAKDIPRSHARWIGQLLVQLSDRQIRDAFLGAGYSAGESRAYAAKVRERIGQLVRV